MQGLWWATAVLAATAVFTGLETAALTASLPIRVFVGLTFLIMAAFVALATRLAAAVRFAL